MTWLMVGKVALLVFLALGCSVLVIAYVRRRRTGIQPMRDPNASPFLDLYTGTVPPTPRPEWAAEQSDDTSDGGPPGPRRR